MKKLDLRALACLLAVMLCMAAFSMTALAYGGDENASDEPAEIPIVEVSPAPVEETEAPAEETPEPVEEPPAETEPEETTGGLDDLSLDDLFGGLISAFTPSGNLSLIDDFNFTGMDSDGNATSKQFITVQSKTGNYFFIIIDRVADTENVYFLNMVDEADLLAMTDTPEDATEPAAPVVCTCEDKCYAGHVDTTCAVCATDMTKCTGKEVQPEPTETPDEPEPETPEKKGGGNIALVILLLLAGGGGAAYYFLKVKGKAKPQTKGNDDLDDYDYGAEDGDEYEFEQYDPDAEGGAPGEDPEDGA